MAKNKIERIDQEITKVREKIAEYQERLKALEAQKTEAENLEIVQMVRALRMTPAQLSAMLSGGTVPGSMVDDNNEQEENLSLIHIYVYKRQGMGGLVLEGTEAKILSDVVAQFYAYLSGCMFNDPVGMAIYCLLYTSGLT